MAEDDFREDLRTRVVDAVVAMHAAVVELGVEHFFPHTRYPQMRQAFDNSGMPSFWSWDGPADFTRAIGPAGALGTRIDEQDVPEYLSFRDFVRRSDDFRSLVTGGYDLGQFTDTLVDVRATVITGSLLERIMHTGAAPSPESIQKLYEPLERGLFDQERPIEAVVPLVCVDLEVDQFEFADGVRFERLNDDVQLSRMALSNWGPVQEVVVGAATHALVVAGGISRPVPFDRKQSDEIPRAKVDRALRALRITSHEIFGYAQVVVRPVGWASSYLTNLPPLEYAVLERRYPPSMDQFAWLEQPVRISVDALEEARGVFAQLSEAPMRVQQAAKRIDRAQMRDDPDDAVVDYCIGLESLLDDSTHTETTHKCALRAAAILAETDDLKSAHVFKAVKRAYGLRSAIVHGHAEDKVAKQRTLELDGQTFDVTGYVRHLVHRLTIALLTEERWADPAEVDRHIVESLETSVEADQGSAQ